MTATRVERHLAEPLANGSTLRPEFRPYHWREPSSPYRARVAAAILAEVGEEEDAWDTPEHIVTRYVDPKFLAPCGTEAAYRRHLRRRESCATCTSAHTERKPRKGNARIRRADIAERMAQLAEMKLHTGFESVPPPGYITASEAARRLGVHVRTVVRYLERLRGAA